MNLTPLLIMDAILLVLTVVLAIAERLLINYGVCRITVTQDDGTREVAVQGGNYLHNDLLKNGITLTTACGGKAMCGYCKVRVTRGGGSILPTEESFMDREEKREGMRLACQVKVRGDLDIYIPDYLVTVRKAAKNKTFDESTRWRFLRTGLVHDLGGNGRVKFTEAEMLQAHDLVEQYRSEQTSLVPVLQSVNTAFNYLPPSVFPLISDRLRVPLSTVYRVATFYNAFSLIPRGKHVVSVCLGTACYVKGAANVLSSLERELAIKVGETTPDMLFTLAGVRCIGCCGLAPVLTVGEDVHGQMTVKKVSGLIGSYRKGSAHAETAA